MSDKENDILDPFQIPDEDEQPASSAKDQEQPKEQRPSASTSLSSSSREHTPIASLKDDFTNHFAISDPDPSDDADADADADKAALGGGSSDDLPSSSPFAQSNNNGQAESSDKSGDQQTQPARQTTAYPPSVITIIDAQKSTDGASSYIVYVIQNGSTEAKRRYSEFEAFREALVKLHPTLIIPPIPSKHTLSDYAAKQSKAKEDATIIARRKRMLQSFLRRCDNHPKLRGDEALRKFLDGRFQWSEIVSSPPLSHLPRSNLKAPAQNPADPHASPAYASLPLPSSVSTLRQPNQRFIDSEAFTNRFANHLSGSMEKVNRRLMRRWTEASADYAELGAILNGFSLTESGQLATAIERTGQAADSTYISTGQMLRDWEERFTEPLHEYVQFAAILQKLLKWRHLKHLQYELAQDALEAKKLQLEELERIENEARRLEEALERGGGGLLSSQGRVTGSGVDASGIRDGVGSGFRPNNSVFGSAAEGETQGSSDASGGNNGTSSASAPGGDRSTPGRATSPTASPTKRQSSGRSSGYGLLGAITHTFQSVMDVDRDASRRSNISKLREEISSLEEALSLTANDLHFATTAIQADLDRFQRQKVADFKQMTLDFAKMHREYCRINLENWKEAKAEIDRVERPPGMPESSLVRKQREDGGGNRLPRV